MRQRARQFLRHGVPPGPAERTLAEHYLEPALLDLFFGQEPRDVVHSANTARWLLDRGHDDPDLIRAALLHDIGKGEQRRMDRVAHVVTSLIGIGGILAAPDAEMEFRRAIARARTHAAKGAELLVGAGVSPQVIALVKKHHERPNGDGMLRLLQEADAAT